MTVSYLSFPIRSILHFVYLRSDTDFPFSVPTPLFHDRLLVKFPDSLVLVIRLPAQ